MYEYKYTYFDWVVFEMESVIIRSEISHLSFSLFQLSL